MELEENDCSGKTEWVIPPLFDELYREYKDAVFHFAYYLTHSREEAEELFQDSWLRIVKHMPEKVNMSGIKSWIFTIVANLHRDNLRKKRVRRLFLFQKRFESEQGDEFSAFQGHFPGRLDEAMRADAGRDIARAIEGLPERQRQVFLLKEVSGFQQAEICDILGIPIGTVKSLMHRAVKRLQRELSAYNPKRERIKCDVKTLSF